MSLEFFISSFTSWNSFGTLFFKMSSSWLTFESTKALEIKTSMLLNLDFGNPNILPCSFFFFLIVDLYYLIPAVNTQIINPIAELVIPIEIPTKEAKSEMGTHPVTVKIDISRN